MDSITPPQWVKKHRDDPLRAKLEAIEALAEEYSHGDFSNPQWDPHKFRSAMAEHYSEFHSKVIAVLKST